MIRILQIGFGPLGIQIGKFIADKKTVRTVAGVDLNPSLIGSSLKDLDSQLPGNVQMYGSVTLALQALKEKPDIAIITTVSSLQKLIPQVKEVAAYGIPVISTCEELSYPWNLQPELSQELDDICKSHGIACLGTGINPGFLMDYLPSVFGSVCKDITHIKIERIQNATPRRVPFQQKIGAGLSIEDFRKKEATGTLRHVGLQESVYLLANCLGWDLDKVTESLEPVVAKEAVASKAILVPVGAARGVEQISYGYIGGECKISMHFKAAIGEQRSYDKVSITGAPNFTSIIEGGLNGDITTCAIVINSVKSVLNATPGLKTMADIGVPGFVN